MYKVDIILSLVLLALPNAILGDCDNNAAKIDEIKKDSASIIDEFSGPRIKPCLYALMSKNNKVLDALNNMKTEADEAVKSLAMTTDKGAACAMKATPFMTAVDEARDSLTCYNESMARINKNSESSQNVIKVLDEKLDALKTSLNDKKCKDQGWIVAEAHTASTLAKLSIWSSALDLKTTCLNENSNFNTCVSGTKKYTDFMKTARTDLSEIKKCAHDQLNPTTMKPMAMPMGMGMGMGGNMTG